MKGPRESPPVKVPKKPTPPERIPRRIANPTPADHLAVMSRAIFQAGLSWAFIDGRWPAFVAAFDGFDVALVAAYGEAEIERLASTDGIVRSRGKIAGTIENARTIAALVAEFGSIEAYAARFESPEALFADARARFAYLGDLSCYYWCFRTGLPVPRFEVWIARQDKDHPRMREMVLMGRSEGVSSETA